MERRRAGYCVGIARRQQQCGRDAHGPADARRTEPIQPRSSGGRGEQRYLSVLVRQRPGREAPRKPRGDIITED